MNYFKNLDSVRAVAIILVIISHGFGNIFSVFEIIPTGAIGVTFFFVLSGFLITRILLVMQNDKKHSNKSKYYNFFMRRLLRIFPVYYLLLSGILFLGTINIKINSSIYESPLPYYLFYYNNFLVHFKNWADFLSPLWSVAVEEQFYVIWSIIFISIIKKENNFAIFFISIALGIMSRFFFILIQNKEGLYMPTCIDCFAIGGFYAYILEWKPEYLKTFSKIIRILSYLSVLILSYIILFSLGNSIYNILFFRTHVSIIALHLILVTVEEKQNIFTKILSLKPLNFIGKISYSVYLFHMVIPVLVISLLNRFGFHSTIYNNNMKIFGLLEVLTLSTISWYFLEKPILNLKRYFKN